MRLRNYFHKLVCFIHIDSRTRIWLRRPFYFSFKSFIDIFPLLLGINKVRWRLYSREKIRGRFTKDRVFRDVTPSYTTSCWICFPSLPMIVIVSLNCCVISTSTKILAYEILSLLVVHLSIKRGFPYAFSILLILLAPHRFSGSWGNFTQIGWVFNMSCLKQKSSVQSLRNMATLWIVYGPFTKTYLEKSGTSV